MKKLLAILSLCFSLSCITSEAANAIASWDANKETNVVKYKISVVGGGATNTVTVNHPTTSVELQSLAVGVTYTVSLSAVSDTLLESVPVKVVYTPSLGLPPEVEISSHSIDSYANGYWYGVKMGWPALDKVAYGFTNYTLIVDNLTKSTRTPIQTSTNTYSFAQLPRATYRFSVVVTNVFGSSLLDTNSSWVLDGTVPLTISNAKIVPITP
jgi:hypothetical protein